MPAGPEVLMQTPMLPARAREALGHVRGALNVARQQMLEAAVPAQRRVERVDRRAWHAEHGDYAFLLHDGDGGVGGFHFGHHSLRRLGWLASLK